MYDSKMNKARESMSNSPNVKKAAATSKVTKYAMGGMVKKGYNKGGYVACGASNPGTQRKK